MKRLANKSKRRHTSKYKQHRRERNFRFEVLSRIRMKYKCFSCCLIYEKLSELKMHMFINHICLNCFLYFRNSPALRAHIADSHEEYACCICSSPYIFANNHEMVTHCSLVHPRYLSISCLNNCSDQRYGFEMKHLCIHIEEMARDYLDDEDMPRSDTANFEIFLTTKSQADYQVPLLYSKLCNIVITLTPVC